MNNEQRRTCAGCAKKFVVTDENHAYRPFCSARCKMIDLGQWLGEKYVVGGEDAHDEIKNDDED